ncbi:MAG: 23S rRNA (adenine(2503)-C(2))-methyltransferase RlmN [Bacteroidetes bacterium HGW-Bacteroidetes-21]|nr:MAG: 23S rRNA (adenine(2503)-C(2))-methyltransferase RlmN [Bacteroidetes bacterium HGW-Bacteroidetes-21]
MNKLKKILKKDIRNISNSEMEDFFVEAKEPLFRKKQLNNWIWNKGVSSFAAMANMPKGLINRLEDEYAFYPSEIVKTEVSEDATIKALIKMQKDTFVEGVLIPSDDRVTACISTQAGCPLKCSFCATGTMGFKRNLTKAEIFDQFFLLNKLSLEKFEKPLSNLVLMGMGEPFLNLENVVDALTIISSPEGLNFSSTRITISTIGIPMLIEEYAEKNYPWNLALSLHSSISEVRKTIIPASTKYPLDELQEALKRYSRMRKKPITVEFLLLRKVNTSMAEAESLVKFCSVFSSKINLIQYNEVPGLPFQKPTTQEMAQFLAWLRKKNVIVTVRRSMGSDISAACGQLANNSKFVNNS